MKNIDLDWNKTEFEHMKELIEHLKCFRRKYKHNLFYNQENKIKDLEKELIRIYKTYSIN